MKHYITGFDLANTVRMAHTQRRITFFLVEGETDLLCMGKFVLQGSCEILVCHGRATAIQATELLDESRELGFLTLLDADFDRLAGRRHASPNCVVTDLHDLIVVLFCSSALDRLLAERGSSAKIAAFVARIGHSVKDQILNSVKPLGYLRWINDRENYGLRFTDLDFAALIDRESLILDFPRTVLVVAQRSNRAELVGDLQRDTEAAQSPVHNLGDVCSGHDLIAVLATGLRYAIGSQRSIDTQPDTLELELRLAFDWDSFRRTEIYEQVSAWETRNEGWKILAGRGDA